MARYDLDIRNGDGEADPEGIGLRAEAGRATEDFTRCGDHSSRHDGRQSRPASETVGAMRFRWSATAGARLRWIQPRWTDFARRTTTSLKLRLLGCVALALIVSLGIGGAIGGWNVSRVGQTKMRSALEMG